MKNIFTSKPIIILELLALLFFGFKVGKEILERKAIEKEVARLEAEIGKLQNNKDDLGALLEYAKTDSFVEKEAREKLNLVKQGEEVLVIPDVDVSLSLEPANESEGAVLPKSHVRLWWEYFFDNGQMWME